MNTTNDSSFIPILYTVKASFFLLDFLICCVFTVLISHTVWRDSALKNEVRFFFLCHHLVCLTLYFGLGTIHTYIRASQINAPVLVCWIIFAIQIIIGRAALLTLVLMALNTCIAVCWPLKYLRFAHSLKSKVIICLWIIAFVDPMVSVIHEGIQKGHQNIVKLARNCPTTLTSQWSRVAGLTFTIIILMLILGSYIIIFIEGKRAGHFTTSNHHARRTILIHGLQLALHIIPTMMNIWIGGRPKYIVLELTNFIIFSFAQCFSPVVYGVRCTELRRKFISQFCCWVLDRYGTETTRTEE